jgi:multidrug resistance efflux pump
VINRRQAIEAGLAAVLAPRVPRTVGRRLELLVTSPEDATILKLEMLEGTVEKGQALAKLSSPRLRWLESRLRASVDELDIEERAFKDGRVTQTKDNVGRRVVSAQSDVDAWRKLLDYVIEGVKHGQFTEFQSNGARKKKEEAQLSLVQAERDLIQTEGTFDDLKDRIEISRARLLEETKAMLRQDQQLEIVAPAAGLFVARVGLGGFVAIGDPIGSIYPGGSKDRSEKDKYLVCAAPEDAKVSELKVLNGQVKKGQSLAVLDSTRLTLFQSQLDSFAANLDVQRKPFRNGRVDETSRNLDEEVKSREADLNLVDRTLNNAQTSSDYGYYTPTDLAQPRQRAIAARVKFYEAIFNSLQFRWKATDTKERIKISEYRLKTEREILDGLKANLEVIAPENGTFVASVGPGNFVQTGDAIGILYL